MDAPPVQYVTSSDGYNIAYTVAGAGQPFISVSHLFSHLQILWSDSDWPLANWLHRIAERFFLVYYDSRGQGLSTRGIGGDVSIGTYVSDLEAVIDRTQIDDFVLFGYGGHVAIHYASMHPERVRALVLECSAIETKAWPLAHYMDLASQNWELFLQNAAPEQAEHHVREMQASTSQSDFLAMSQAFRESDVGNLLPKLTMPTLVLHPRDFKGLRVEESVKLAARIPDARLVLLDGATILGDVEQSVNVIEHFVANLPSPEDRPVVSASPDKLPDRLSQRELEILRLVAAGQTNQQIADELVISRNTVRRHVSNIFDKTGASNRAQVGVYARDNGLL